MDSLTVFKLLFGKAPLSLMAMETLFYAYRFTNVFFWGWYTKLLFPGEEKVREPLPRPLPRIPNMPVCLGVPDYVVVPLFLSRIPSIHTKSYGSDRAPNFWIKRNAGYMTQLSWLYCGVNTAEILLLTIQPPRIEKSRIEWRIGTKYTVLSFCLHCAAELTISLTLSTIRNNVRRVTAVQ